MRRESGFTLIEAIVATGLLVTLAAGAAQLLGFTIAQIGIARQQLLMGSLARAKIDEISAGVAAGAITATAPDTLERTIAGASDAVADSGRTYVRRWRVTAVPGYDGEAFAIGVRVLTAQGGSDFRLVGIRIARGP